MKNRRENQHEEETAEVEEHEEEAAEVEQEEEKMEVEEEKVEVENKVEVVKDKKKPSPKRRHSVKGPPSPGLGPTDVPPLDKKDIPVKWGPIKNASAALSISNKAKATMRKTRRKRQVMKDKCLGGTMTTAT